MNPCPCFFRLGKGCRGSIGFLSPPFFWSPDPQYRQCGSGRSPHAQAKHSVPSLPRSGRIGFSPACLGTGRGLGVGRGRSAGRGRGAGRTAASCQRRKNMAGAAGPGAGPGAAGGDGDDSLYPIAVLIDELRNEDVQVLDWDWGAETSAEEHLVGKREGRLSRGGGSGVGRTIVGVRSGPGRRRLRGGPPPLSAALPRASGAVAPRRSGSGRGTSSRLGWASPGGLRDRPGAEERPGGQGPFEVLRVSVWLCRQTGPASWVGRAPQLINSDVIELFSEKGGVVFNRFTCFLPSGVFSFQNFPLPRCFHSFISFPALQCPPWESL